MTTPRDLLCRFHIIIVHSIDHIPSSNERHARGNLIRKKKQSTTNERRKRKMTGEAFFFLSRSFSLFFFIAVVVDVDGVLVGFIIIWWSCQITANHWRLYAAVLASDDRNRRRRGEKRALLCLYRTSTISCVTKKRARAREREKEREKDETVSEHGRENKRNERRRKNRAKEKRKEKREETRESNGLLSCHFLFRASVRRRRQRRRRRRRRRHYHPRTELSHSLTNQSKFFNTDCKFTSMSKSIDRLFLSSPSWSISSMVKYISLRPMFACERVIFFFKRYFTKLIESITSDEKKFHIEELVEVFPFSPLAPHHSSWSFIFRTFVIDALIRWNWIDEEKKGPRKEE